MVDIFDNGNIDSILF